MRIGVYNHHHFDVPGLFSSTTQSLNPSADGEVRTSGGLEQSILKVRQAKEPSPYLITRNYNQEMKGSSTDKRAFIPLFCGD